MEHKTQSVILKEITDRRVDYLLVELVKGKYREAQLADDLKQMTKERDKAMEHRTQSVILKEITDRRVDFLLDELVKGKYREAQLADDLKQMTKARDEAMRDKATYCYNTRQKIADLKATIRMLGGKTAEEERYEELKE